MMSSLNRVRSRYWLVARYKHVWFKTANLCLERKRNHMEPEAEQAAPRAKRGVAVILYLLIGKGRRAI